MQDKLLSALTTDDIKALDNFEMGVYLRAALGVLRLKEIELERAHVDRHYAEYNYHSVMLEKHRALLAKAERVNREGP